MTEAHAFLNKVAKLFKVSDITFLSVGDELLEELEEMLKK